VVSAILFDPKIKSWSVFISGNGSWVKKSIESGSHVAQMSTKVGICAEKLVAFLDIMSIDTLSNMSLSAEDLTESINKSTSRSPRSNLCVYFGYKCSRIGPKIGRPVLWAGCISSQ
jgi:hypothetical protein